MSRLEVAQVHRTGHSIVSLLFRTQVLVLHSTGRRSGSARSTVLAVATIADDTMLIVGGAAGQRATPDWVANLRADPHAEITYRRRRIPVRAEELLGDQRRSAWRQLSVLWPRILDYERRSGRTVPVFELHRLTG